MIVVVDDRSAVVLALQPFVVVASCLGHDEHLAYFLMPLIDNEFALEV
jgi:hypothetical protein